MTMDLALVTRLIPWLGIAGLIFSVGAYFIMKGYPAGDELMQKIADKKGKLLAKKAKR